MRNKFCDHGILMNIVSMTGKVVSIANSMISESALPNFRVSPDERTEFVGVRAFDELHGALNGHLRSRSKEKMDMVGHDDKEVQKITTLPPVMVKSLEE